MPPDKHKGFLQVDSITFVVRSQVCLKYPKQQVYNISFQYLNENVKDEADFLPADKRQIFPQSDTIILDVRDQT